MGVGGTLVAWALLATWGAVTSQHLCPDSFEDHEGLGEDHENVERGEYTEKDWQNSVEKLIMDAGYAVETHEIRTADGYLLTYHRIPRRKVQDTRLNYIPLNNKPTGAPVLLQHGVICSSACWALAPEALAFVLADAGFDVWLGNARGNTYSRKHARLNPDKHSKFWDFSWHEMGYYDLPAGIDYILDNTGQKQLFYIGHSMGTTMYFVLGATRPTYMAKVKTAVLMSPVMYPYHVRSVYATFVPIISLLVNCAFKSNESFAMGKGGMGWISKHICQNKHLRFACFGTLFAASGFDMKQFDKNSADKIFRFTPAGLARKVLQHFLQIKQQSNGFRMYDYGNYNYGNFWMYGETKAPEYKPYRLTAPMVIYYAENDLVISPKDVQYTVEQLPPVWRLVKVPFKKFTHLDFMWAKDAKSLLYDDVIQKLKEVDK